MNLPKFGISTLIEGLKLDTLVLYERNLSAAELGKIAASIGSAQGPRRLSIPFWELGQDPYKKIARDIFGNTQMAELRIGATRWTKLGATLSSLIEASKLRVLKMAQYAKKKRSDDEDDDDEGGAPRKVEKLKKPDKSQAGKSVKKTSLPVDAAMRCATLQRLELRGESDLLHWPIDKVATTGLLHLKIHTFKLSDETCRSVAKLVAKSQSIRKVELFRCTISKEGYALIAKALATNKNLTLLSFEASPITRTSIVALLDGASRHVKLKELCVGDCGDALAAAMQPQFQACVDAHKSLKEINYAGTTPEDDDE